MMSLRLGVSRRKGTNNYIDCGDMDQLIRIVQKIIINLQVIFESGLVTSRKNNEFKGYQK